MIALEFLGSSHKPYQKNLDFAGAVEQNDGDLKLRCDKQAPRLRGNFS